MTIRDTAYAGAKEYYYLTDDGKLYRTLDFGGGSATWTLVFDVAVYQTALGLTDLKLCRVVAYPGLVAMVGVAKSSTSGGQYGVYLFKSNNQGVAWTNIQVQDSGTIPQEYTVTHNVTNFSIATTGNFAYYSAAHQRQGDEINTVNPWGFAVWIHNEGGWHGLTAAADTVHNFGGGNLENKTMPLAIPADGLTQTERNRVNDVWFTDYFGGPQNTAWARLGSYVSQPLPLDAARTKVQFSGSHGPCSAVSESWVFWHKESVSLVKAFDVAKSNHAFMYLSVEDGQGGAKILHSTDGGQTWAQVVAEGANDIKASPTIPGLATYWSSAGSLKQIVAGIVSDAALDTESPVEMWGRIAYSPDGNYLFTLPGGAGLKRRFGGQWTTYLSGGAGDARGLRCYRRTLEDNSHVTQLAWVDGSNINFCWNAGLANPLFELKKGGWAWGSGVSVDIP